MILAVRGTKHLKEKTKMAEVKKLKVGVLGVGLIGELHARVFSEIPTADLIAIADSNKERARKVGRQLQCEYCFSSSELLNQKDIEAVSICTPDRYHVEPAISAAKAGKHILLEKPIARTVGDGEKIKKAAEDNDVRLMVAHILRFDPRYVQLHDKIRRGDLGELIHIRAKRQNPRGVQDYLKGRTSMLHYIGVHDIDIVLWYVQSEVEEIFAKKASRVHDDDCIFVLFSFRNGVVGSLEFSWSLPEDYPTKVWGEVEAVGTKGAGYIDVHDQGLKLFTNGFHLPDTMHWPEYNGQIFGDLRDELMHFVDATLSKKEFLMSTEDSIKAVGFIEACLESIQKGAPVKLG